MQTPRITRTIVTVAIIATSLSGAIIPDDTDGASRTDHPGVTRSSIDSQGHVVVDGQRFLPIGFYGVNWREPFDDRMASLATIADSGANTVVLEDISTPRFGELLDEAHRLGLKVIVGSSSLSDNSYIGATVDAYQDKPAVLGWALYDDADDGKVSVSELATRNAFVKAKDPDHFTLSPLTGYYTERRTARDEFIAASDSASLQMYPVGPPQDYSFDYGGDPLTESYSVSRDYVRSAEAAGTAMFVNTQTFSWANDGGAYPSVDQLRNMFYGQVAAGADGIIAFQYSQDLVLTQPELWNEYRALAQDATGTLEAAISRGDFTRGEVESGSAAYSTWELDGEITVVMVNTSSTSSTEVTIPIPSRYDGQLISAIPRLPATLTLNDKQITGTLEPGQVQVYRIATT